MAKAVIIEDKKRSKILHSPINVKINQKLPFRVRFSNIGVPGYASGAAPIGIAVIGLNNYIL